MGICTGSYITHFNHTTPHGDEGTELREQVHPEDQSEWIDGQKQRRPEEGMRGFNNTINKKGKHRSLLDKQRWRNTVYKQIQRQATVSNLDFMIRS